MSCSALVIAAHGSPTPSSVHEQVQTLARELRNLPGFSEVTQAFHYGQPNVSHVLDSLSANRIVVVPMMTSEGHFCQTVLQRELARNKGFGYVEVCRTRPVGTHPEMANIVYRRVTNLAEAHGFRLSAATIGIVAHGTMRNSKSRDATEALADQLRVRPDVGTVVTGYLDDDPAVESLSKRSGRTPLIVIPFLIGGAFHALEDVPQRMGLAGEAVAARPLFAVLGDRKVIVDRAVGEDPAIVDIVRDLALSA